MAQQLLAVQGQHLTVAGFGVRVAPTFQQGPSKIEHGIRVIRLELNRPLKAPNSLLAPTALEIRRAQIVQGDWILCERQRLLVSGDSLVHLPQFLSSDS